MGRKTETDEQKVKKVYPDACICICGTDSGNKWVVDSGIFESEISKLSNTEDAAWSDALRQINAAKRKKYYKRKITRPNNEKKGKLNIMMYPSHQKAVIAQYGSVQKFINNIVEQLKTK